MYIRISKDRPGEASTATQEAQARALIEQRGWTFTETYSDIGISGFKRVERPAYERMLDDVRVGRVDAVVVFKLDRMARSVREFVRFTGVLEDHGVVFASCHDPVDTSTPVGRAILGVLAVFAELESEQTSLRLRASYATRAAAGETNTGGRRPFGYAEDRLTVVEAEADLIRDAARRFLDGATLAAIARDWNAREVTTTSGGPWTSSTLSTMLRAPRLAGYRSHGNDVHRASWQPILTEQEHLALVESLDSSRNTARRRSLARHTLSGLVRCGLCGHGMSSKADSGAGRLRYVCRTGAGLPGCGRVTVDLEQTEAEVRDVVLASLDGGALAAATGSADVDADRQRVQEARDADTAALEELARDFYVSRLLSREEFLAARTALSDRLRELERDLHRLAATRTPHLPVDPQELAGWWQQAAVPDRRAVLDLLLDAVVVHPARVRGLNRFDPDRLEYRWRT